MTKSGTYFTEKWITETANDAGTTHLQRENVKNELNEITVSEHSIKPYFNKDRGEPDIYPSVDINPATTESIRSRMMVHALVRSGNRDDNDSDDINPEDQDIPSFT